MANTTSKFIISQEALNAIHEIIDNAVHKVSVREIRTLWGNIEKSLVPHFEPKIEDGNGTCVDS